MTLLPPLRILLVPLLSFTLLACAASSASAPGSAEAAPPDITREVALKTARSDAAAHFQALTVAATDVEPKGTYWVVELRSANGSGLRYAISMQDGSIRQRATFQ